MLSGDVSVIRAPDSWSKGRGFESLLERRAIFSSSGVNFLSWLLFRYPLHPPVTAVARKIPRSFCQQCGWKVTAEYACTLRMWLLHEVTWHGAWLYGVHRTRRDGNSFMSHQPCQRWKYTTSVDSQKRVMKSYSLNTRRITCERCESARERRIPLYQSDEHQQQQWDFPPQSASAGIWLSGRAPDSWLKDHGFESPQERRENFILHCHHSVLTHFVICSTPMLPQ